METATENETKNAYATENVSANVKESAGPLSLCDHHRAHCGREEGASETHVEGESEGRRVRL